jgi:hypothetical protein
VDAYRTADWAAFRAEVIRLDGGACLTCGRTSDDGVVLQVHHKQYLLGHKPWEYPFDLCETTCSGCHAATHGHIPPRFGWTHVGWDDLGDLTGTCECCGTAIRYVFLVEHSQWRAMEVGETCCDNLTSSQVASGFMESKRRYADRLKRFVCSSRWRIEPGNVHHIRQKKLNLEVVPKDGAYLLRVDWKSGKLRFASVNEAKAKAFEIVESGKAAEYLIKLASRRAARRI